MTPVFIAIIYLCICSTNIGTEKIDGFTLKTYEIVIAGFSIQDKLGKARFFEKTFLLIDTNMEVVLEIPFVAFSNVDIQFDDKSFTWRSYSTAKALSTTRKVELIDKHDFIKAALDKNYQTFVVHVATLGVPGGTKIAN